MDTSDQVGFHVAGGLSDSRGVGRGSGKVVPLPEGLPCARYVLGTRGCIV